jgi:hypothetical protein
VCSLNRSFSFIQSFHQKEPFALPAWGDLTITIVSLFQKLYPGDVLVVVKFVHIFHHKSFVV